MIDYHLHLWPHGQRDIDPTVEYLAQYLEKAQANGVVEIAVTEHLFRFSQTDKVLGDFFKRYPDTPMRTLMQDYWKDHARADLDRYVEVCLAAKAAGLPIVMGLEVDYYEGSMDKVTQLLADYPFDVLLGSIHWVGDWPFDHTTDPFVQGYWAELGVENAWEGYTRALEELAATSVVDVLAHPDLIKVTGMFPNTPNEFYDRIAEAARDCKMVAEVSSAGWRKPVGEAYPSPYLLSKFASNGVEITTASDAHSLGDVSFRFNDVASMVKGAGYDSVTAFSARQKRQISINVN
ncbi:histidinol-phosphatase [Acidithrix ferrooxidans]|uniref:Histidinol-phosphatase n=1 Tax=Acidithrix ferrooxidans TaxID=1280514 RepID=A0A0D8HCJ7_9ACTN|nr:histidinol-phosphatase [Acidithrix ferrooxidans]KJF15690.1 histidinol-phosphatase [Acidithrix ferrooxidans]